MALRYQPLLESDQFTSQTVFSFGDTGELPTYFSALIQMSTPLGKFLTSYLPFLLTGQDR